MKRASPGPPPASGSLPELMFLQRLSTVAASTIEPDELLALIIREATGAMHTDVCSLYLYEPDADELVLTATNGLNQRAIGRARMRLGEGVTGWVAQRRRPLPVPDVAREPRFRWVDGVDEKRFTSMLSVPIVAGPRVVGVLNVQTVAARDFTAADLDFLSAIAGGVAGIIERSELQRRLQAQLEEIQRSQRIHERFTTLALAGAGPSAILEAIGSLAGAAVALFDHGGLRLERGGPAPLRVQRVPVPSAWRAGRTTAPAEVLVGRHRQPLTLTPIWVAGELVAILGAAAADPDPPGRRQALEHGATVLALELAKEQAAAEVERRLRGDLVEELLRRDLEPEELHRLAVQAARLGHRIAPESWVMVTEPDDDASAARFSGRLLQDRLHAAVSDACGRRFPGTLVVTRPVGLVCVLPAAPPGPDPPAPGETGSLTDLEAVERFAAGLLDLAHRVVGAGHFSTGIGNRTQTVADLPRAYEEARQALRLRRRGGAGREITSYRSLGALRLLLEVRDPAVLRHFVDETLGPLLRYATRHRTPLLPTLETLARVHWNRSAAARALHVHVNSLSYRIQRIEQLAGLSLEDPEARVVLSIALQARTLLGTGDPQPLP